MGFLCGKELNVEIDEEEKGEEEEGKELHHVCVWLSKEKDRWLYCSSDIGCVTCL